MTKNQLAIEELKIFQSIIQNHDEIFNKIRGWCLTLISGLSVAYISNKSGLDNIEYLMLSTCVLGLFSWTEAVHRVAQERAIQRSGEVEKSLRGEIEYNGPYIYRTFKKGNKVSDQIKVIVKPRFFITYISLIFITLIIGFSS